MDSTVSLGKLVDSGPSSWISRTHVESVLREGVYLYLPTDNPAESVEIIQAIRKDYPPHYGPVTYRGRSGNVVTTVNPILIGTVYMILLEKTGGDFSGVSSAKLQHFGVPAKLTKFDKYSTPVREQPVRMLGESEVRSVAAVSGPDVTADTLDQSNSPASHKEILSTIFRTETPTHIPEVLDRRRFPAGNGRNLVFIRHLMECAGAKFIYVPESTQETL